MRKPVVSGVSEELLSLARRDLAVYISLAHSTDMPDVNDGMAIPSPVHEQIIDALMGETGHTLILAPRGAAKTTIVQAWLEWLLGRASCSKDREWANRLRIIYISATAMQA